MLPPKPWSRRVSAADYQPELRQAEAVPQRYATYGRALARASSQDRALSTRPVSAAQRLAVRELSGGGASASTRTRCLESLSALSAWLRAQTERSVAHQPRPGPLSVAAPNGRNRRAGAEPMTKPNNLSTTARALLAA